MLPEGKEDRVCFVYLFGGLERAPQWGLGPAKCLLDNRREKVRRVGVFSWAVHLEGE